MWLIYLIGIGLSILTVGADALIKRAALQNAFSGWRSLLAGAIIYGLTAFGWFFLLRKAKLSTLGALYAITLVVFVTLVSVFVFKEKINFFEIIGLGLAIASLAILYRFA